MSELSEYLAQRKAERDSTAAAQGTVTNPPPNPALDATPTPNTPPPGSGPLDDPGLIDPNLTAFGNFARWMQTMHGHIIRGQIHVAESAYEKSQEHALTRIPGKIADFGLDMVTQSIDAWWTGGQWMLRKFKGGSTDDLVTPLEALLGIRLADTPMGVVENIVGDRLRELRNLPPEKRAAGFREVLEELYDSSTDRLSVADPGGMAFAEALMHRDWIPSIGVHGMPPGGAPGIPGVPGASYSFDLHSIADVMQNIGNEEGVNALEDKLHDEFSHQRLTNWQRDPFTIHIVPEDPRFDIPFKVPDATVNWFREMSGMEAMNPELGQRAPMITSEQMIRLAANTFGTPDAMALGALEVWQWGRGMRGVREWIVRDETGSLLERLERHANKAQRAQLRGSDELAASWRALDHAGADPSKAFRPRLNLTKLPPERVGAAVRVMEDSPDLSSHDGWRTLRESVKALDPKNPDDVARFRNLIDELSLGRYNDEALQYRTGRQTDEALDWEQYFDIRYNGMDQHEIAGKKVPEGRTVLEKVEPYIDPSTGRPREVRPTAVDDAGGTVRDPLREGRSLASMLDTIQSDMEFGMLRDTLVDFGRQAGIPELENLYRIDIADNLRGTTLRNRPIAMTMDGRVIYYNTPDGADVTPLANRDIQLYHRLATGRPLDYNRNHGNMVWIETKVLQETDTPTKAFKGKVVEDVADGEKVAVGVPTLQVRARFPVRGQGLSPQGRAAQAQVADLEDGTYEVLIDGLGEHLRVLERTAATRRRTTRADRVKKLREKAEREVEAKVYRNSGVEPSAADLNDHRNVTDALIATGRRQLQNMPEEKRRPIERRMQQAQKQEADKAQARYHRDNQDEDYRLSVVIELYHKDRKMNGNPVKVTVPFTVQEVTSMTGSKDNLRDVINWKMTLPEIRSFVADEFDQPVKYYTETTEQVMDAYTGEIVYRAPVGGKEALGIPETEPPRRMFEETYHAAHPAVEGYDAQTLPPELDESAWIFRPVADDVEWHRKRREANPQIQDVAGPKQGAGGTADDVIEELFDGATSPEEAASRMSKVFEMESDANRGGGGGRPPGTRVSDEYDGPMDPAWKKKGGRPLTLPGMARDPERVLGGTGIFEEVSAAEFAEYRLLETLVQVTNRRSKYVANSKYKRDRLGRYFLGESVDEDGVLIELSGEEAEFLEWLKGTMDIIMDDLGHKTSDDVRDYFALLLKSKKGKEPIIDPALLDRPARGNAFYSHLLPELPSQPVGEATYDIIDALTVFYRASARKSTVEPAMKRARQLADAIDLHPSRRKYMNFWFDEIAGKQNSLDRTIDELTRFTMEAAGLHKVPGLRGANFEKPVTRLVLALTRQYYRGFLGLSVPFFIKNSSQVLNTMSEVGIADTLKGMARMWTPGGMRDAKAQRVMREFNTMYDEVNIGNRLDKIIFAPVNFSEFMNRGISFHAGVSSEARRLGISVADGMKDPVIAARLMAAGHTLAQRTQFVYGVLGRSPIFRTNLGRLMGQFGTFPIKQAEFLAELARHDQAGFIRYLALTGFASRGLAEAGVDPTGFVGFGFLPGAETGSPFQTPAGLEAASQLVGMSLTTGDWREFKQHALGLGDALWHLIPASGQVDRTFRATTGMATERRISPSTQNLVRYLSDRERFMQFFGLRTMEAKLTSEQMQDVYQQQNLDDFHRSIIVSRMADYYHNKLLASRSEVYDIYNDEYMQRLVQEARGYALPITTESVKAAVERRELPMFLRTMMENQRQALRFWNRSLYDTPGLFGPIQDSAQPMPLFDNLTPMPDVYEGDQ